MCTRKRSAGYIYRRLESLLGDRCFPRIRSPYIRDPTAIKLSEEKLESSRVARRTHSQSRDSPLPRRGFHDGCALRPPLIRILLRVIVITLCLIDSTNTSECYARVLCRFKIKTPRLRDSASACAKSLSFATVLNQTQRKKKKKEKTGVENEGGISRGIVRFCEI